jgi:chorismate mutase/prephenate dehydratase
LVSFSLLRNAGVLMLEPSTRTPPRRGFFMGRINEQLLERDPMIGNIMVVLGPDGSFSSIAGRQVQLGEGYAGTRLEFSSKLRTAVELVGTRQARYAIVPIENSTDGDIGEVINAIGEFPVQIVGEHALRIQHSLFYQDLDLVQAVASKGTALQQCDEKLGTTWERLSVESTTKGVEMAGKDPRIAGIGPKDSAVKLGIADKLTRVDGMEDNENNVTTFVILQRGGPTPEPTGNDKVTFIMTFSDRPGALVEWLEHLNEKKINLNKLRSFGRGEGTVSFLASIDGHQSDYAILNALLGIEKTHILGSYPKAEKVLNDDGTVHEAPLIDSNPEIHPKTIEQVKREMPGKTGETIAIFTLRDKVGALLDALKPFADHGVNLTGINSLPTRRVREEYAFIISFQNNNDAAKKAVEELEKRAAALHTFEGGESKTK